MRRSSPGWSRLGRRSFPARRGPRASAIATSVRAKAAIVEADEREESGTRALLNLGHTFGHALEAFAGYSDRLLHGEAIAIGMRLAFTFSAEQGLCPADDVARVERHLAAVGLPGRIADIPGSPPAPEELLRLMAQDKKVKGGKLALVLVRGIGQALSSATCPWTGFERVPRAGVQPPMIMGLGITLGAILGLLIASAFFSGSETALTAASRAACTRSSEDGNRRARIVNHLLSIRERLHRRHPARQHARQHRRFGARHQPVPDPVRRGRRRLRHGVMTVLVVLFAEVLPKTYAIVNADRMALAVAPLMRFRRRGARTGNRHHAVHRAPHFAAVRRQSISDDADVLSAHEEISGAIELHHKEGGVVKLDPRHARRRARSARADRVGHHGAPDQDGRDRRRAAHRADRRRCAEKLAHPRAAVARRARGDRRHPARQDLAQGAARRSSGDLGKLDIMSLATPPWFVPDTTTLKDQLNAFLKRKAHFAIVVDEYGEVMGLVTLEDIIEEIVGDITDETDIASVAAPSRKPTAR